MASEKNLRSIFSDIADAIREKAKTTDKIKTYNMAEKIHSIKGGSVDILRPIYTEQKNPVPNTGFVKSIYFDTSLTTDQVDSLINNANLDFVDGGGNLYLYQLIGVSSNSNTLQIMDFSARVGAERGAYWIIGNLRTNKLVYASPAIASQLRLEAGWQPAAFASFETGEFSIDAEVLETLQGIQIGLQNNLLTDLVFILSIIDTGEAELAKTLTDQYKLIEKTLNLDTENNTSYNYDFVTNINEDTKEINIIKNIRVNTATLDGLLTRTLSTYSNDRITTVGRYAFSNCKLTNISLPKVKTIAAYAFADCKSLETVDIPLAQSIGTSAFSSCKRLVHASFPLVTTVNCDAFEYASSLESIDMPLAETIESDAFRACQNLTKVDFPAVGRVAEYTYWDCKSLESANLPQITFIGNYAFFGCCSLVKLFISQKIEVCTLSNKNAFDNCYHILGIKDLDYNPNSLKDGYIYVPASLLSQYKVATNWVTYASQIIGHEDLEAGATLPNYTTSDFTTQTWYSDEKLTNVVTSVSTSGTYYCKLEA